MRYYKHKDMQQIKNIIKIGSSVKIEIEGYGTITQIDLNQKLYQNGLITWERRNKSQGICFSESWLTEVISQYNLYPRQF